MDPDDKQLIEYFLAGDETAFEKLVKRHLKPVFNFLNRLVKNIQVAEDLAQETFLKVWRNMDKFDSRKSRQDKNLAPYRTEGSYAGFKTWLFTIAKNTAYDYFKKKKTVPFAYFEDAQGNNVLENIKADISAPEENLDFEISLKHLEIALEKMPEHHREILYLCYKDDFTLQEIAEILGESYNTVKSRHARALANLKNIASK